MTVWVPTSLIGVSCPSALQRATVRGVTDRSVDVEFPDGTMARVASSKVHTRVGVAIVRVGDFATEEFLLNPLAESLDRYARLVLVSDEVRLVHVRSIAEFAIFWGKEHPNCAYLVLVGHGGPQSMTFGVDGSIGGAALAKVLEGPSGVEPKILLSLACQTGRRDFASPLSGSRACSEFLAPYHSVHGAVASQFSQTFLAHGLLSGASTKVACRRAMLSVPTGNLFRLWRNGKLVQRVT